MHSTNIRKSSQRAVFLLATCLRRRFANFLRFSAFRTTVHDQLASFVSQLATFLPLIGIVLKLDPCKVRMGSNSVIDLNISNALVLFEKSREENKLGLFPCFAYFSLLHKSGVLAYGDL